MYPSSQHDQTRIYTQSPTDENVGYRKYWTYFGLDSFEASADGAMRVTADNVSAVFA